MIKVILLIAFTLMLISFSMLAGISRFVSLGPMLVFVAALSSLTVGFLIGKVIKK
jgi:hypothetical protein